MIACILKSRIMLNAGIIISYIECYIWISATTNEVCGSWAGDRLGAQFIPE